jgi:hypothetical protein
LDGNRVYLGRVFGSWVERLRLRGLSGARDEFHLAAIVQNHKTLALRLIRPPPEPSYA